MKAWREFSLRAKESLRWQLTSVTLLGTLATSLFVGATHYRLEAQDLRHEKAKQANHLTQLVAQSLVGPLQSWNTAELTATARFLVARDDIRSVHIRDAQNVTVVNVTGNGFDEEPLIAAHSPIAARDGEGGTKLGSVEITLARQPYDMALRDLILQSVLGTLLLVIAVSLGLGLIFWRAGKPLGDILASLNKLERGETDLELSGLERPDELGKISRALVRFRDAVSERQLAEQQLRDNEQRSWDFSESTADWFWEMNAELRFSYFSPNFQRIFGVPGTRFLGQQRDDFFARDQLNPPEKIAAHLAQIRRHEPFRDFQYQARRGNGETFWIEISGIPYYGANGDFAGYRGVGREITRRMAVEETLRQLSQAVEQSVNGVMITDTEGRIEYVNEAFSAISGYLPEEVRGHNPRLQQSGTTPAAVYSELWAALEAGRTWHGEFANRRKDGEIYFEYNIISPIRQADGRITHYLAIKEDITEKKLNAEELEQHRHQLERMVGDRTRQLEEAREVAEQANRTKTTFLANMSHEIRTPMNAVMGMTYLLRRDGVSAGQQDRLDKIDNAARHLLGIIDDILDISRIEAGKLVLEETTVAIPDIVENTLAILSDRAREKGLGLAVDVDDVPAMLLGDPTRITQSLINYAGNAIKFTDKGSVTLRVRLLENGTEDVLLRFEVQDTGIGIASEALGKVFNAFEQADASTTRRFGGSGLGLSITRHLAQLMGGDAGAESELGVGSTFWFTARLRKSVAAVTAISADGTLSLEDSLRCMHQGARILLVEDEPMNQEIARELLADTGLVVRVADNGAEALEKIGREDFDLILMDLQMPVMDGLTATRLIRRMPAGTSIPIIAVTANAFEEDRQSCAGAGMNDFIPKPVDPDVLFTALLKWLPRQRQRPQTGDSYSAQQISLRPVRA